MLQKSFKLIFSAIKKNFSDASDKFDPWMKQVWSEFTYRVEEFHFQ